MCSASQGWNKPFLLSGTLRSCAHVAKRETRGSAAIRAPHGEAADHAELKDIHSGICELLLDPTRHPPLSRQWW
jgi:hypothetical protein